MNTKIIFDNKDKGTIEYIGYYSMLDRICKLWDKVSNEERKELLDKYIKILELIKGE